MLAKVFRTHVTQCQTCKGGMAILAAITNGSEVVHYLNPLGIERDTSTRSPPRHYEAPFEFGSSEDLAGIQH